FLVVGTATPKVMADELGIPLGSVSYHIRFLRDHGILRLVGRTPRRGASVHHYQLSDRRRVVEVLWGITAELLVTDFERDTGKSDMTVALDREAVAELERLNVDYLPRLGELGLQTRERRAAVPAPPPLIRVAVLFAAQADVVADAAET